MPPRKTPTAADGGRLPSPSAESPASSSDPHRVAEAEARAEVARARATQLRQLAEGVTPPADATHAETAVESAPTRRRRWVRLQLRRPRRPSRKALAVAGAIVVICASLTASGLLVWHHRDVVAEKQRSAEFATVARNAMVTMMSIDPGKAREQMQRFSEQTTGMFKISFLMGAEDMVKAVEQSKVSTKATVQGVAVQSMSKDSALVLVAARTEMTKPGEAKPSSRVLRAVVGIQRDAGQLKISRVEFVP